MYGYFICTQRVATLRQSRGYGREIKIIYEERDEEWLNDNDLQVTYIKGVIAVYEEKNKTFIQIYTPLINIALITQYQ